MEINGWDAFTSFSPFYEDVLIITEFLFVKNCISTENEMDY